MTEETISTEQWLQLFQRMDRIKEMAIWDWMLETDIFGVQNPENGEFGFISVMGNLGSHYGVAVYLGWEGFHRFMIMQQMEEDLAPDFILETAQLQASWNDRNLLNAAERNLLKNLGLKYRGRNAWPSLQSFRPGYVPWKLEAPEARFLAVCLQQLVDVAPRCKFNPSLLHPSTEEQIMVRRCQADGTWEDTYQAVADPPLISLNLSLQNSWLDQLAALPIQKLKLQLDFGMILSGIQEKKNERPFYPYLLLLVEASTGMVMDFETLRVDPTLVEMYEKIPGIVIQKLLERQLRPAELQLRSPILMTLLEPLAQDAGLTIKCVEEMAALDEIRAEMLKYL